MFDTMSRAEQIYHARQKQVRITVVFPPKEVKSGSQRFGTADALQ